ncbi:hypothetical protein [Paenibacillus medicaginis]|uniref:Uncharacterized protein n=1 Tax=Paenibacillus medicaginis TaxID=1470560 RepID=A0ABV5BY93_9BACL
MIQIKPYIEHTSYCPDCNFRMDNKHILWQGIHVCSVTFCHLCGKEYIEDLRTGHATYFPFRLEVATQTLIGPEKARKWLGEPFKKSILNPSHEFEVKMEVTKMKDFKKVIVMNCIDYLYGHSLLKLLNAQRENEENEKMGIIVIITKAFEWMIPDFISEVWCVNIPFHKARNYYPQLHDLIHKELERFDEVYLSRAYSHPSQFDIEVFTSVKRYHRDRVKHPKITFIWREDRLWIANFYISKLLHKYPEFKTYFIPFIYFQKWKVTFLFRKLKKHFPNHEFAVSGIGVTGRFPGWVKDGRTSSYTREMEHHSCKTYSESELVIGVHGSNMLLPSAHAGMTLNLIPKDRWGNFAQDILFQKCNEKVNIYLHRLIPIETRISVLTKIINNQINGLDHYIMQMTEDIVNSSIYPKKMGGNA